MKLQYRTESALLIPLLTEVKKLLEHLKKEQINPSIIEEIKKYWQKYADTADTSQTSLRYLYYGKEIWEAAVHALLCGENLLLAGSKATGKNVLAENLARAFRRPCYNLSFHINMDASSMIGNDTFRNGEVVFRPGLIYQSAIDGGFCILDEINMARNEALAVLHSVLDFRRTIHIPGYDQIPVHPATRFIATMNYGYAGTRELNEALASRFVILQMPSITQDNLTRLLLREFPGIKKQFAEQFSGLFSDIEKKCESGELTEKVLDLRGLLDALRLIQNGLSPYPALDMGLTNKTFDAYEQTLIRDIITTRISKKTESTTIFS